MSLSKALLLPRFNSSTKFLFSCHRSIGQWPSNYLEPLETKADAQQPMEDDDPYRFLPIKAKVHQKSNYFFNKDHDFRHFVNMMMYDGEKKQSLQVMLETFEIIKRVQLKKWLKADELEKQNIIRDPMEIFHKALHNCKPLITLAKVSRGGITYMVPSPITDRQASFRAKKWIIRTCREKPLEVNMRDVLSREFLDAANGEGRVVKKKQELHKQCEANKAFAHYRWN